MKIFLDSKTPLKVLNTQKQFIKITHYHLNCYFSIKVILNLVFSIFNIIQQIIPCWKLLSVYYFPLKYQIKTLLARQPFGAKIFYCTITIPKNSFDHIWSSEYSFNFKNTFGPILNFKLFFTQNATNLGLELPLKP